MSFTDETTMPFGKHYGKELQDVPARYLLWFKGELEDKISLNDDEQNLLDYISDNLDVLEKEINS